MRTSTLDWRDALEQLDPLAARLPASADLLQTAAHAGLRSRSVAAQVIRRQRGQPVEAHICVFARV